MPQIYAICGPGTLALLTVEEMWDLGKRLVPVVEKGFRIEGHDDVAFTAIRAEATRGEADIQVEVRYTAGTDEYGLGEPFEPSVETQRQLVSLIEGEFISFLRHHGLPKYSLSVWCKPHLGGFFRMCGQGGQV